MFSPVVSNVVQKCLQKRYCAVSKVKVERLFLQEIRQWNDNFPPFERTSSISVLCLMRHLWTMFFDML